jgi:glycosyl hydrolase family 18 (putative chitinase)
MSITQVNAWILLGEDEPAGTGYSDPNSCFQTLIRNNVYRSVDALFICFTQIVPTSAPRAIHVVDGYTLQTNINPTHPGGQSDEDYMRQVIADARKNNPNIRFLATLDPGDAEREPTTNRISQIFAGCSSKQQMAERATAFAKNVVAFLRAFGLHGWEIDWESPVSDPESTTQEQFEALARGLKGQFGNDYQFVMNTASTNSLTGEVVNATVDFLTLQLYASWVKESDYLDLGILKSKLAYGATFEAWPGRQQTPEDAYAKATAGGYTTVTQWRLNSRNFQEEQDGQVKLYRLCKGR